MFSDIYVAIQQAQILQLRVLEEAGQARRWRLPIFRQWALTYNY